MCSSAPGTPTLMNTCTRHCMEGHHSTTESIVSDLLGNLTTAMYSDPCSYCQVSLAPPEPTPWDSHDKQASEKVPTNKSPAMT